ncbi:hypothetical protein ACTIVE_2311 [Actinomadura verrucosospora]|uniref:Uncharacterized protein n=1 Tax=Actinomadura verrucosospora TaxID=46165 RepID=A0A7D3VRJ0_ACTVE|nr:hypothetical protein ACTIVE_2311 [Actinomadura verrucosospora]
MLAPAPAASRLPALAVASRRAGASVGRVPRRCWLRPQRVPAPAVAARRAGVAFGRVPVLALAVAAPRAGDGFSCWCRRRPWLHPCWCWLRSRPGAVSLGARSRGWLAVGSVTRGGLVSSLLGAGLDRFRWWALAPAVRAGAGLGPAVPVAG